MGTMTRRFGLLLACVAGLGIGCKDKDSPPPMDAGPDDAVIEDGATDGGVDGDQPTDMCETRDGDKTAYYFITRIAFDRMINYAAFLEPTGGTAVGFNLDGVLGQTCNHVDYEWEGVSGIDNNMVLLLDAAEGLIDDFDVNVLLRDSVIGGDVVILAQVSNWNGTAEDDCIDLALLIGTVPADAPDDYIGTCEGDVCTINPDLEFGISQISYQANGHPRIRSYQQVLDDGRVLTEPSTIVLDVPFGDGASLSLIIRDAQIRLDISEEGISDGILGGVVAGQEMSDALLATGLIDDPALEGLIPVLIQLLSDMDLDAYGACSGVSIGMSVEGMATTVTGISLCERHGDCNDGNACTINVCGSDGLCIVYSNDRNEPCGTDSVCDGMGRCVQCFVADDCPDDGISCTTTACVDGRCVRTAHDSMCPEDGNACTAAWCDPSYGCDQDYLCDDGFECTQDECDPEVGCSHEALDYLCNDGIECTVNTCAVGVGCQTANVANSTSCNGGAGTCQNGVCEPV
jgi:hypothetical protein